MYKYLEKTRDIKDYGMSYFQGLVNLFNFFKKCEKKKSKQINSYSLGKS